MLSRGLEEIGHEAKVLYLGDRCPAAARDRASCGPPGPSTGAPGLGHGLRRRPSGRLLATMTARELGRARNRLPGTCSTPRRSTRCRPAGGGRRARRPAGAHPARLPALRVAVRGLHDLVRLRPLTGSCSRSCRALRLADAVVTVDTRLYLTCAASRAGTRRLDHALMNFIDTSAFSALDGAAEEALRGASGGCLPDARCCSALAGWSRRTG